MRVRPPRPADERRTRTQPTVTSFGWPVKAAATAALWLFALLVASRATRTGLPLLVFVGVPYVVVALLLTRLIWRAHRTS